MANTAVGCTWSRLSRRCGDAAERQEFAQDAVRLYDQGWSIRRVAEEFGVGYGLMRRILRSRTVLRDRGGKAR
ncbi:hypothetical protein GCM10023191_039780 [Actinoallomurus oryzae]|uniref:Helix-turn-helix domain-containing protein n=1 Tax=Actinoallomurus oryzae TaxID=502180 RepID=A0ABP8Q4L1_9ACTN